MLPRIEAWLARPRGPWWLGLLGIVLSLPALRYGLQADDTVFPWRLSHGSSWWALFEDEAGDLERARHQGFVVWWSSPKLAIRFFRPLASLSHAFEFSFWPNAAWLMHLVNIAIYGVTVVLAAQLYRQLSPAGADAPAQPTLSVDRVPPSAALAGLLFAVNPAHALSVGWIAGRNTVLALCLALLALSLHVRARDTAQARFTLASVLTVALALCTAEAGLWSLMLLLSFALALTPGSLAGRLRSIAPQLGVGALWAAFYTGQRYGLRGSSFYRDPSRPLWALLQGIMDLPVWFSELAGPGGVPFSLLFEAEWVRLAALPIALVLGWLLAPALGRSRECRFYALATLLCVVPTMFALPQARVGLGAGFGAFGWIACSIVEGRQRVSSQRERWAARSMLAIHLVLAPLVFIPSLGATEPLAYGTRALTERVQPERDVIVVQAPVELLSNYTLLGTQVANPSQAPRSVQHLYTGASPLWVQRVDDRTLELTVDRGWGAVPMDRIFCAPEDLPRIGSTVRLPPFRAEVLSATGEGRPERVRFHFATALESPERQFLTWQDNRVVPFEIPKPGARVRLTPSSFFAALAN